MSCSLWNPLQLNPAHAGAYTPGCEASTRLQEVALSLPSSAGLSPAEQSLVIAILREALA